MMKDVWITDNADFVIHGKNGTKRLTNASEMHFTIFNQRRHQLSIIITHNRILYCVNSARNIPFAKNKSYELHQLMRLGKTKFESPFNFNEIDCQIELCSYQSIRSIRCTHKSNSFGMPIAGMRHSLLISHLSFLLLCKFNAFRIPKTRF